MAMNGTDLGTEINAAIAALSDGDQANALKVWQALGQAIVAHVQTNGQLRFRNTDAGIQRDPAGGNPPTLAPASTVTLAPGSIE